jgi:hypothetical protein
MVVWNLLLQADPEGSPLIVRAASWRINPSTQNRELRVAEKNNYPILLVFRPGYGVALTVEYA